MAVRAENGIAPSLAGRRFDGRQPQGLVARTIGIEHHGAQFRQLPGDQALAACHAAEETEDFHGIAGSQRAVTHDARHSIEILVIASEVSETITLQHRYNESVAAQQTVLAAQIRGKKNMIRGNVKDLHAHG